MLFAGYTFPSSKCQHTGFQRLFINLNTPKLKLSLDGASQSSLFQVPISYRDPIHSLQTKNVQQPQLVNKSVNFSEGKGPTREVSSCFDSVSKGGPDSEEILTRFTARKGSNLVYPKVLP